jgi:hypothetical protein
MGRRVSLVRGLVSGEQMYDNVALVHQLYPDKHLLFTEGTPATFD